MIINTTLSDGYSFALHQFPEDTALHSFKLYGDFLFLGYKYTEESNLNSTVSYFIGDTLVGTQAVESGKDYYWNITADLPEKGLYEFKISMANYERYPDELIYKVLFNYIDHPYMTFELNESGTDYKLVNYNILNANRNIEVPPYAHTDSYGIKPLTNIEGGVFMNNSTLQSVVLSENITAIGATTFFGCINLSVVTILAVVPPVLESTNAFEGTESIRIYVPRDSLELYENAPVWADIAYAIYPIE